MIMSSEKIARVVRKIGQNVAEYYEAHGMPIKSGDLVKTHRGIIYQAGADWELIETALKQDNKIRIVLSLSNTRYIFPGDVKGSHMDLLACVMAIEEAKK